MSSAGTRSGYASVQSSVHEEGAARASRTALGVGELLEALGLRGHDRLGERVAEHAHVHRRLAVGIGRCHRVAAALGIDDRLGGEHVLGDQLRQGVLGQAGWAGQERANSGT